MRLFLAITPPPEVRETIASIQAQARTHLPFRGLRWERPEKWHITMRFLGTVDEALVPKLCTALAELQTPAPFSVVTGGPGAFPSMRRPRVLWLGLAGDLDALHLLHAGIHTATSPLIPPTETRPFTPHLTLARISQPLRASQISAIQEWANAADVSANAWVVHEFELWQSTLGSGGSQYTLLRSFPLAPRS